MATGTATRSLKAMLADPASDENTTSATVMERTYWPRLKAILCEGTLRSMRPTYTPITTAMVRTPGLARTRPAAHIESVRARYRVSVRCRISNGNCSVIEVARASAASPTMSAPFHLEISPNRTTTPMIAAPTIERIRTRTGVEKPLIPAAADLSSRDRSLARSISAVLPDELDIARHVQDHRASPTQALPS